MITNQTPPHWILAIQPLKSQQAKNDHYLFSALRVECYIKVMSGKTIPSREYTGLPLRTKIQSLVESDHFEKVIVVIIALNALTLGLESFSHIPENLLRLLFILDSLFLTIFIVELALKAFAYRARFFHDPWRVFDFLIVGIACLPASGAFSVLRSLRILRALRMISAIPTLKKVVNGLVSAIPGLGAVIIIIGIIFYVSSVMATKLFGEQFPEWFGNIALSSYSLFQVMTLESWSMGIVRPVMEKFPYAWLFFLPFIFVTTFTMLNLFIAVIVNAMQPETESDARERAELGHQERTELLTQLEALHKKIDDLSKPKD